MFPCSLFPTANHHLRPTRGEVMISSPSPGAFAHPGRALQVEHMYEATGDAAYLAVDLSGANEEDVRVKVDGQKLFVTAVRHSAKKGKKSGEDFVYSLRAVFGRDAHVKGTTVESVENGTVVLRVPFVKHGRKQWKA